MGSLTMAPVWVDLVVLVTLPTLLAMLGTTVLRRTFSLESLSQNNEVAGFKFAVVGVLYAVLLAFAVIAVWQSFSESESKVAVEAGAAATLYRLAEGIGGPTGAALHDRVTDYLQAAINDDWPAMARGEGSSKGTATLDALFAVALRDPAAFRDDGVMLSEILSQLDQLTQARRARLNDSSGFVPPVLWVVLYVGAVVTVSFTFFFGTPNVRAQTAMTGLLTFLIGLSLLVVVAIDRPFGGWHRVTPRELQAVLQEIGGRKS